MIHRGGDGLAPQKTSRTTCTHHMYSPHVLTTHGAAPRLSAGTDLGRRVGRRGARAHLGQHCALALHTGARPRCCCSRKGCWRERLQSAPPPGTRREARRARHVAGAPASALARRAPRVPRRGRPARSARRARRCCARASLRERTSRWHKHWISDPRFSSCRRSQSALKRSSPQR